MLAMLASVCVGHPFAAQKHDKEDTMLTITLADVKKFLPLLIPLIVIEFILLAYVLWHINTHREYKRGSRLLWNIIAIVGMEYIGPILYLVLGKSDDL